MEIRACSHLITPESGGFTVKQSRMNEQKEKQSSKNMKIVCGRMNR
jgi:hypothetical protein